MKIARVHSGLIIAMVSVVLLAACGAPTASPSASAPASGSAAATSAPSSAASASTQTTTEAETTTASAGGTFPVTIEHKFGSTTIEQAPERVVALGYTDLEPMLALGVTPVAARYFFGDESSVVWPWAEDAVSGDEPQVLNQPFGTLNFEEIAALQPDLIVGVSAGLTEEEYATLREIAPTLAQSPEYVDFGVPWQEQTQVIGRALGAEAQAQDLVAATEAQLAQVREEHPEFEGATAAIVAPAADGQFFVSGPQHERQRILMSMGFTLPDELAEIAGDQFFGTISGERIPLIDTDVLIFTVTPEQRATVEANPVYQQLSAVGEGRVIFLDTSGGTDLAGPALVIGSVLSLPVVFDELVPQLAAAVDGDPQTTATVTAATPEPDATQAAGDTRTITHAMGTTEVPANPQRVVVLDTGELDTALALGVTPVGAVEAIAGEGYQAYFSDATDGIENVGTIAEPNLETIVRLQPDLILSNKVRHEDIYEQLSQIAPTVFAERVGVAWKENFMLHADALGKAAEAEAMMAQYDARVAELRAQIGDPQATEVSIVRFLPEQIRLYQRGSFIGTILDDIGFARPLSQQATDETWLEGNKERIMDMDGDLIFTTYYGDETAQVVNDFKTDPLWAQLSAVQRNRVYDVSDDHWMLGIGMLAANRVLDDLEQYVAGGAAASQANP